MRLTKVCFFTMLSVAVSAGCNSSTETAPNIYKSAEFDELVAMHCRARALKDMRFELADELRQHTSNQNLQSSDSLKKARAKQSRALGDSIGELIQQLTKNMSLEEKRAFSDSVDQRIVRVNCFL
ncbi:MAG: hypothetical protein ABR574_04705 [Cryomorphaceae bacterium]